jgi:RNase P subunit RPR2
MMDGKENKLEFKNIFFQKTLTCENCEKAIVPRSDVAFKDMKYGIILCLECKDKYLQGKINLV